MPLATKALGPGKMVTEEVGHVEPGPGEVGLKISHCGVCGSDLHFFNGSTPPPAVCPGHEISAVVSEIGAGVTGPKAGDRVAVEPIWRCGECERCRRGDYHLCEAVQLYGVLLDGGMAEELRVPAYCLHTLPSDVDLELGALTEPLAVGVHAARLAGVTRGSQVLVLGAGSVGLLQAAACRHLGAEFVAITAKHEHQKERARALGCDQVLDPDAVSRLDCQPSVVIETIGGRASTLDDAVSAVTKGGSIIMVGIFEGSPAFNSLLFLFKEATMVGSMVYNRREGVSDFEIALDILSERRRELAELVSHRFALTDVQTAFETAADKGSGAVKVLVRPGT